MNFEGLPERTPGALRSISTEPIPPTPEPKRT